MTQTYEPPPATYKRLAEFPVELPTRLYFGRIYQTRGRGRRIDIHTTDGAIVYSTGDRRTEAAATDAMLDWYGDTLTAARAQGALPEDEP